MLQRLKDLFIPCTRNGYRPNFLERVSVGIMLVLILISFAVANIQALLWIGSDWMVSTILPAVIVDLTNSERDHGSLGELTRSDILDKAAQLKADDMAKHEYFAHYSPSGISPWHWFDVVSYDYIHAGENLAVYFTDSSDVVQAWMNSPAHKANIMNGSYTEIGVGTAKGSYKGFPTIFVVQLFGTPNTARKSGEAQVAGASTPQDGTEKNVITLETLAQGGSGIGTGTGTVAEARLETKTTPSNETVVQKGIPSDPVSPNLEVGEGQQETLVLYSDLATSTRPDVTARLDPNEGGSTNHSVSTNMLERSATEPSLWLQVLYGLLALIVIIALILSIVIEWRRQNPIQIAYAGGLLAIMALLFHIHVALTSGVTIV